MNSSKHVPVVFCPSHQSSVPSQTCYSPTCVVIQEAGIQHTPFILLVSYHLAYFISPREHHLFMGTFIESRFQVNRTLMCVSQPESSTACRKLFFKCAPEKSASSACSQSEGQRSDLGWVECWRCLQEGCQGVSHHMNVLNVKELDSHMTVTTH